jgi:hypothetical protein
MLDQNNQVVTIDNKKEAAKAFLSSGKRWMTGDKQGAVKDAMKGIKHLMDLSKEGKDGGSQQQQMGGSQEGLAGQSSTRKNLTRGAVIQWSGCMDHQTSADAKIVRFHLRLSIFYFSLMSFYQLEWSIHRCSFLGLHAGTQ